MSEGGVYPMKAARTSLKDDPELARELADAVAVVVIEERMTQLEERAERFEGRVADVHKAVNERFERLEALLHAVGIVLVEACEKKSRG